jgi:hypothetical protein
VFNKSPKLGEVLAIYFFFILIHILYISQLGIISHESQMKIQNWLFMLVNSLQLMELKLPFWISTFVVTKTTLFVHFTMAQLLLFVHACLVCSPPLETKTKHECFQSQPCVSPKWQDEKQLTNWRYFSSFFTLF